MHRVEDIFSRFIAIERFGDKQEKKISLSPLPYGHAIGQVELKQNCQHVSSRETRVGHPLMHSSENIFATSGQI